MTREEFVDKLIEEGWKMNGFGHYVKGDRTVRLRYEEVNFGKGWLNLSDAKLSDDGKKLIWELKK